MGWKDWSSWIKGGVVVNALILFVSFFGPLIGDFPSIFSIFVLPGVLLFFDTSYPVNLVTFLIIFSSILIYFAIGAIIGWIIGKIKGN